MRLLGRTNTADSQEDEATRLNASLLETLTRERLQELSDHVGILDSDLPEDRRDTSLDARRRFVLARRIDAEDLLEFGTPYELKGFCRALDLTEDGRDPDRLRQRLRHAIYLPTPSPRNFDALPAAVIADRDSRRAEDSQRVVEFFSRIAGRSRNSGILLAVLFSFFLGPFSGGFLGRIALAAVGFLLGREIVARRSERTVAAGVTAAVYVGWFGVALALGWGPPIAGFAAAGVLLQVVAPLAIVVSLAYAIALTEEIADD